jgi:hypothetical protein
MGTKTNREGNTPARYTATDLEFYTDHPDADKAAALASDLINKDQSRYGDLAYAASLIANYTAGSFPGTGANDTASREAIWAALKA